MSARRVLFAGREDFSVHPDDSFTPEYIAIGLIRVTPSLIAAHLTPEWSSQQLQSDLRPVKAVPPIAEHIDVPFSAETLNAFAMAVLEAVQLARAPSSRNTGCSPCSRVDHLPAADCCDRQALHLRLSAKSYSVNGDDRFRESPRGLVFYSSAPASMR
jgi:hypothetical protein